MINVGKRGGTNPEGDNTVLGLESREADHPRNNPG